MPPRDESFSECWQRDGTAKV